MEGHYLIIKKINCNSDSNHEQFCFALRGQNDFTGGGKFFPWGGGNPPPRYIVKKGTAIKHCYSCLPLAYMSNIAIGCQVVKMA